MGFFKPFLFTAISLVLLDFLLPNVTFGSWWAVGLATITITLLLEVVKPVLSVFLLPITIVTLGLFRTVLTLFLMWLATAIVPGFHVDPAVVAGYWVGQWVMLLLFAFFLNLLKSLLQHVFPD